jgi:hypothetical protein
MVDIPFKKQISPKKVSVLFILTLILIGLVVGTILSIGSINRANQRIGEIDPDAEIRPLFPFLGMTLVTVNIFIILGLLYTHLTIFKKTKSKFLIGLLLFLIALLIKSMFAYSSIQLLTIVTALRNSNLPIVETLEFSGTGFGGIFIFYHIFEFFVLSIFLYVSKE